MPDLVRIIHENPVEKAKLVEALQTYSDLGTRSYLPSGVQDEMLYETVHKKRATVLTEAQYTKECKEKPKIRRTRKVSTSDVLSLTKPGTKTKVC